LECGPRSEAIEIPRNNSGLVFRIIRKAAKPEISAAFEHPLSASRTGLDPGVPFSRTALVDQTEARNAPADNLVIDRLGWIECLASGR
jgi:hypothetical protein